MQAVGREAPGDVCDARSWSPVASQFLPILEESRSPSADARALAPFKGNWRSGDSARARELPPPPSLNPLHGLGPGSPLYHSPHPNLRTFHSLWGNSTMEAGGPALAPHPTPLPNRGDSASIGTLEENKMLGLERWGILPGQGHRANTGEDFIAQEAALGLWRPASPPASCFRLFSLGSAWGQVRILARRPLGSFPNPFI